jgi:putative transcription factor
MQCELCGGEIRGQPKTVRIEGAELQVCLPCSRHGVEVQQKRAPEPRVKALAGGPPAAPPRRRRRDLFDRMGGDIAEDYADRIRNARMARGWSQKQLALEIMEKEMLIRKIEKGELVPEEELRKKLEKALGIRLLDTESEEVKATKGSRMATTFGDIISLKK